MLSDFHDDAVDFPPKPEKKPAAKKKAPEEAPPPEGISEDVRKLFSKELNPQQHAGSPSRNTRRLTIIPGAVPRLRHPGVKG